MKTLRQMILALLCAVIALPCVAAKQGEISFSSVEKILKEFTINNFTNGQDTHVTALDKTIAQAKDNKPVNYMLGALFPAEFIKNTKYQNQSFKSYIWKVSDSGIYVPQERKFYRDYKEDAEKLAEMQKLKDNIKVEFFLNSNGDLCFKVAESDAYDRLFINPYFVTKIDGQGGAGKSFSHELKFKIYVQKNNTLYSLFSTADPIIYQGRNWGLYDYIDSLFKMSAGVKTDLTKPQIFLSRDTVTGKQTVYYKTESSGGGDYLDRGYYKVEVPNPAPEQIPALQSEEKEILGPEGILLYVMNVDKGFITE